MVSLKNGNRSSVRAIFKAKQTVMNTGLAWVFHMDMPVVLLQPGAM
jgi:hypothetical protein